MVNDPIADFLVRLQNASAVGHASVSLPYSSIKNAIAKILEREGYLTSVVKKNNTLVVGLSYQAGRPAINGVKRLSKPSRRVYMGVRDVRPVRGGHGVVVLSTPAGVVTGKEAREKRVGGEVMFEIW